MAVIIPQVVTSDRASGAQVIDGSLKFDASKSQYLTRTPGSAGNRKTWTWSCWLRRDNLGSNRTLFSVDNTENFIRFQSDAFHFYDQSQNKLTSTLFRDSSGWYNLVLAVDYTASAADMVKGYINGSLVTWGSVDNTFSDTNGGFNDTTAHEIGRDADGDNDPFDGSMSQVYFVDGQALEPSEFGYTDGLTNTWKPKKYTGTFGTNGFWLPMDGNSPIGKDMSGQGNDWTPVNFGGSVALDNPQVSGAKPILNTTPGGTQAGVGVFGSKQNVGYAVTVYNDGGGNKYYIDGVKTASITGLIRGATYTFDTSDSTVSSHPFRLSATSNGSHGGGSEYTNGVAAITGAATTITVPHDAPETLYYYCTVHSGMGNDSSISGITTNEKLADQYASHCVLAVPFISGVSDDVSPSIACTSTKKTLTKQGDPTSSTSSNFYSSSTDFDGTGDYYTSGSESDFAFGTGDFTVEFWFDSDGLDGSQDGFLQISDTSGGLKTGYTNGFAIYEGATAGGVLLSGLTGTIPAVFKPGVWNHVALVREGTSVRLYANGVLKDTQTSSKNISGTYLALGGYYSTTYVYNGRMQDFRIYKGVAKYNGSFEVPVTSPAILPDTPSGVSGSSKLTKITDGAVAFDGDGDYLTIADSTDFDHQSTFTWECFLYLNAYDSSGALIVEQSNGSTFGMQLYIATTGVINFNQNAGTVLVNGGGFTLKRWNHIAVSHDGTTIRLFLDGKIIGQATTSNVPDNVSQPLNIGRVSGNTAYEVNGFISNLRFVNGTALYTSNFTPSTEPLTNVTNTKLLCCQSNTSATEAAVSPSTPTANGNAAATNFTPFNTDINTVRGQETGYCTLNPLTNYIESSTYTLPVISDGNLTVKASTTRFSGVCGDIFATSGKFYAEVTKVGGQTTDDSIGFGARTFKPSLDGNVYIGRTSDSYGFYGSGGSGGAGRKIHNNGFSDYGSSWGALGDVMGLLMDLDNETFSLAINNINQGVAYSSIDASLGWTFTVAPYNNQEYDVNFGQKPFKFSPPDGFQPLNAANTRPTTVIARPDQFVGVTTYTGSAPTAQQITGLNFGTNPDFVWVKNYSDATGYHHALFDTVRGANKVITSSDSSGPAEATTTQQLMSFDHNGFTVGTNSDSQNYVNLSADDYVAWCWKAGGNKNTFNIDDVGYASASDVDMNVGGQNSNAYNTSAIWSGMMSGTSNSGVYTSMFDGADGDAAGYEQPSDGNTLTFTPTGGITASTSIEIYVYQSSSTYSGSADITVNGTSIKTGAVQSALGTGAAGGYVNIGTKSLTTLTWSNPSGSNNDYRLMAIRVDGKILVDSNQTPPNLPSIAPTGMSVGTKQGFSIIRYQANSTAGATIPHGLSQSPNFVLVKSLETSGSSNSDWTVFHSTMGGRNAVYLNETSASAATGSWNNTSPGAAGITLGTAHVSNLSPNHYIAYAWHDVIGLQKFGSFEGNGNADGPFVELGFEPAVVILKNIDNYGSGYDWFMFDNQRDKNNVCSSVLLANSSDDASSTNSIDFLSNGFKLRATTNGINLNSHTIIYMAWAEAPSVDLFGGGANAR